MTASTLAPEAVAKIAAPLPRRPNLFRAWLSSFFIYFFPARNGRLWLNVCLLRALFIALINFLILPLWLALLGTSVYAWDKHVLRVSGTPNADYVPHPAHEFVKLFKSIPHELRVHLKDLPFFADVSIFLTIALFLIIGFAILYFVLLPFAARPGKNKACALHVLRVVLLSTGWTHIWAPVLSAGFLYFIAYRYPPGLENIIGPLTAAILILSLWTLVSLIIAARQDYRTSAAMPQPHDPWCEVCGYNLTGADPNGRCPECGKPIAESLAAGARPPTPWESRPSFLNFSTIRNQIIQLVRQPRQLFFSMPTLTGQRAAQRWLIASFLLVGLLASFILPIFNVFDLTEIDWSWNLLIGSLFVGFVWSVLALMMVGIETAGIATFSRMKAKQDPDFGGPGGHQGVFLATSAKVTCYSSILMVPWVFLGGAQLFASQYWNLHHLSYHWHISMRTEQILLALSLSIAHIGGLLWYELTVYRGIRGIQYANK